MNENVIKKLLMQPEEVTMKDKLKQLVLDESQQRLSHYMPKFFDLIAISCYYKLGNLSDELVQIANPTKAESRAALEELIRNKWNKLGTRKTGAIALLQLAEHYGLSELAIILLEDINSTYYSKFSS